MLPPLFFFTLMIQAKAYHSKIPWFFLPPSHSPPNLRSPAQPFSQSTGVTTELSQVVPCPFLLQLRASPSFLQTNLAVKPKLILGYGCQLSAAPGEDACTNSHVTGQGEHSKCPACLILLRTTRVTFHSPT